MDNSQTNQPVRSHATGTPLLDSIDSPSDLRKLSVEQLPQVCDEIRRFLIEHLSRNPGHFASSMGAVDLIVALHYVFDTPADHLVWDVGHQAYAHKILTGRREAFRRQRTKGGISGFPNPMESEADTFMAGHAGNSISAALGMAIADKMTPGNENRKTVAIIGDASISGGLAFEGLNNVSNNPNDLLIVLNDNDMSIDNNVGALHRYLSELTTSEGYNRWRFKVYNFFRRHGLINDSKRSRLLRLNNSLKAFISKQQNIFEGLNIRYFGPFDGHDVIHLVKTFQEIKNMKGPRLLHLHTVKGKGFEVAEKDPTTWHAPGKFDPATGERKCGAAACGPLPWQEVFGRTLVELAERDDRVVGITAAMPSGTSMSRLFEAMPRRAFDVGISEGHAVTFAGGLAAAGKRPFVAIYSSFLQRSYDNIIHDVAIQGLPVVFCIDRAGLVGEDGVTHHGLFDLAYLRCIPGIEIAAPADEATLRNLMHSSLSQSGPLAIRYPRGKAVNAEWQTPFAPIAHGKSRLASGRPEAKVAILSLGALLGEALEAARRLEEQGIAVDVYDMIWLKPLDEATIEMAAGKYRHLVTLEDGSIAGGFGSAVSEHLSRRHLQADITMLGIPDRWMTHATVPELREMAGIDASSIVSSIIAISDKAEAIRSGQGSQI